METQGLRDQVTCETKTEGWKKTSTLREDNSGLFSPRPKTLIIICVFAFRLFKEGMVEFYQVTYKKYIVYNKTHRSVEALYTSVLSFSLYAGRDFC